LNHWHLLKPLIRAVDVAKKDRLYAHFSKADQVTYQYYVGRKAIFDNDLALADLSLSFAFAHCPMDCLKNKRLILLYLIPVKMFLGQLPTQTLLDKYGLGCFQELVLALKDGNLKRFVQVLADQQGFFISSGIFLMLDKLKQVCYLKLMQSMYTILNSTQIKLEAIVDVLKKTGNETDIHETSCILGNLIAQRKMKGYISYNHQTLVLSKVDPFPIPNTRHSSIFL